jgi:transcriptional regulator with XRE-family HTH domain
MSQEERMRTEAKIERGVAAIPFHGLDDLARYRMARLRDESGCSQKELAAEMARLGFAWTRETVAQLERDLRGPDGEPLPDLSSRNLAVDELIGLAIVFGVAVVTFLMPRPGETPEALVLPDGRALSPELVLELIANFAGGGPFEVAADAASGGPRPIAEKLREARALPRQPEPSRPAIDLIEIPS